MALVPVIATRIHRWVDATLKLDATLVALVASPNGGIHPDDTAAAVYPYVNYQMISQRTVKNPNGYRIMEEFIYLVQGVDKSRSFATLEPIADEIYKALHLKKGTVGDVEVLYCIAEDLYMQPTFENNLSFRYLGHRFRIGASNAD